MNRHLGEASGNDSTPNPAIQNDAMPLPERGAGLEIDTAREERGKGTPLTDEERAKRHELNVPKGYVDIVVDGRPVRRSEAYQKELQKKTPITAQERGEFYRNRK